MNHRKKTTKTDYKVLEKTNDIGHIYDVDEVRSFNEGLVLVYTKNGQKDRVLVGNKYRPLRVGSKLWVGKNTGNSSQALINDDRKLEMVPIPTDNLDETDEAPVAWAVSVVGDSTDPDCPGQDLTGLERSNLLYLGIKAVYKKRNWTWVIVIGVVLLAVLLILYLRSQGGS